MRREKENRLMQYEKKVIDDKEQIKKISQIALHSFLKSAEKDFQEFNKKLYQDLNKYKEKLKDEGVAYELKTKANLIAKEAERLLSNNAVRSKSPIISSYASVTSGMR